jgi:class 3 adenylate cyclase
VSVSQVLEQSPLQAGREAISRHEWHAGFDLLRAADELEPLGPDDLVELAEAAWWTGRLDQCIAARERAYALYLDEGKPRRAARVALAISRDYFAKLAHSIGAGWFNRAERLLSEEGDCPERGWLAVMEGMSAAAINAADAVLESAKTALDVGMRFGDRDLQAFGLLLEGRARVIKGEVREGLALLDEATVAAVSGEIGPYASGIIYCVAIATTEQLADYQRAGEWTEASRRWCERQSIAGFPGVCRVHRAEIMRLRGSWAEAETEVRRALAELQNFNLGSVADGFYEIGEIRLRMGDLDEAEDAFRQAHELGRDPQPGLAQLRLARGNAKAALRLIVRALEDDTLDPLTRVRLLCPMVAIAVEASDLEAAHTAADEADQLVARYESDVLRASALCARGQLKLAEGDARGAIQSLRTAIRIWRTVDLPYELAQSRMTLGVALRALGDEEDAQLELQAARAGFERLGAVLDLHRCTELLGEDAASRAVGMPVERVTKTFMFTDIVDSTRLVEALGDDKWMDLLSWHNRSLRELFAQHRGTEIDSAGDGFFVVFDHASEAVECAVAIQRLLARHSKEHAFAPDVRIGLHTTNAMRRGHEHRGKGVHVAARIAALATGRDVMASKEVIDEARPRFPTSAFHSVELKGVSDRVEVASISAV